MKVVLLLLLVASSICIAQDPVRPYPLPASYNQTTSFLNHSSYLDSLDEPQWYLDNIPFVDFPDQALQDVYCYRTSVMKRHLKYTQGGHGWSFTEYDTPAPDDYWTNNQATTPFNFLSIIILPRAQPFTTISLAILDDTSQGGVLTCPYALNITDGRTGSLLALRSPWTTCIRNSLHTVLLDTQGDTDRINITLTFETRKAIAISEIQVWVPSNPGPVYEVDDGLCGTLFGELRDEKAG